MINHRWNPDKAALNLAGHKVPFELAEYLFAGPVVEVVDMRQEYGETRIQAYGRINGRLFQCVYTWRNEGRTRWIISLRKANNTGERNESSIARRSARPRAAPHGAAMSLTMSQAHRTLV